MKHRVRIMQVFKVFKSIVVEVEAADMASAVRLLSDGELTGPDFDHKDWEHTWDLQNEEVDPA